MIDFHKNFRAKAYFGIWLQQKKAEQKNPLIVIFLLEKHANIFHFSIWIAV